MSSNTPSTAPGLSRRDLIVGALGIITFVSMILLGATLVALGAAYLERPIIFNQTCAILLIIYGVWSLLAGGCGFFASACTTPPSNQAKTLLDFVLCIVNLPYLCCGKIRASNFYLLLSVFTIFNFVSILLCTVFGMALFIYATVIYNGMGFIFAIIGVIFAGVCLLIIVTL